MDDRNFDALMRALGSGTSRRTVLRGLLGVGAASVAAAGGGAQAARRGFSGPTLPSLPTPTPTPTPPPCAQVGDACGAGCCSGNCCEGICIFDGACCIDSDCGTSDECTIVTCSANHTCQFSNDASCLPN